MRSTAREVVFKYLFSRLFNPDDEGLFEVILKNSGISEDNATFARSLLSATNSKYEEYLNEIENLASNKRIDRIFATDKCAIIIGMAEYDFFKETPVAVIINEAVNLAGKYSPERSTDFVNGVLAEYVRTK